MEIGFTGTQMGMTENQRVAVASLLDTLKSGHVHHGDCVGADAEFHDLANERGMRIEIHPPSNHSKRAFKVGDTCWPEYPYLERNKHIVNCADVLIATPSHPNEQLRSGTWATVRAARNKGITIYIVDPDGKIKEENHVA